MYAHVKLTQRYSNNFRGSEPVSVRHIFPIPAHATVCGLEMRPSKEKVLKAVAKDSKEAETDFQTAFAKGKWASVLNEVTSDVFVTLISAVPENDEVEITINYVTPLLEDELPHQLRFTLPAFVGQRYGSPPPSIDARSSTGHNVLFSVEVDVQMTSTIQNISSASHLIQTTSVAPTHQIVVLHPNTLPVFLDHEFVLSVQTDKLDEPLCIAEVDVANNTVAMALALVPRFDPDLVSKQEYIFLIDRSDSMQANERMGTAKRAADFLIKHLPSEGTLFNVISFGASFSSLWQSSRPYNEWNTYLATSHVNLMNADMGGIDLGGVLRHVFRTRKRPVSTAIFVLTSGDIRNSEAGISSVRSHMSAADTASPGNVRIFTLGIGQNASTALCEDLAQAGHGLCIMTTETEALTGKCSKLLAAAKASPSMRTIQYEWENDAFPRYSPPDVSDVYPDNRVLVYTVLSQTTQMPNFVTLRLTLPNQRCVEYRAPVTTTQAPREVKLPIHILAAKSVLRELEDAYSGNKKQKASTSSFASEEAGQAMIISLSKDHQLISKLTSFVAVDDGPIVVHPVCQVAACPLSPSSLSEASTLVEQADEPQTDVTGERSVIICAKEQDTHTPESRSEHGTKSETVDASVVVVESENVDAEQPTKVETTASWTGDQNDAQQTTNVETRAGSTSDHKDAQHTVDVEPSTISPVPRISRDDTAVTNRGNPPPTTSSRSDTRTIYIPPKQKGDSLSLMTRVAGVALTLCCLFVSFWQRR